MAQPSRPTRIAARLVAVAGGVVGTMVLGGLILADTLRGRPPPRNS